jgi:PST family polysaccharide transporter/lipopolysaccharide exporter
MAPILKILAVAIAIKSNTDTSAALFNAIGSPNRTFTMVLFRMITLVGAIVPLTILWGLQGAALSVLISACSGIPYWVYGLAKEIHIKAKDYFASIFTPLLSTSIMCCAIYSFGIFIDQFKLIECISSILFGMAIYFVSAFLFQKILNYTIYDDIRLLINTLKSRTENEKKTTDNL